MSDATARQFFGGLPFEIISEIFAHLNTRLLIKCMSLSRLWYEFVPQCTDQWSTIVFRGTLIPGSKSRWSQSIGRCVKRVELRNMDEDTLYLAMERLIEINCHQIGSLKISACRIHNEDAFLKRLKDLTSYSMITHLTFYVPQRLSFPHVLDVCPDLQVLKMRENPYSSIHNWEVTQKPSKPLSDTLQTKHVHLTKLHLPNELKHQNDDEYMQSMIYHTLPRCPSLQIFCYPGNFYDLQGINKHPYSTFISQDNGIHKDNMTSTERTANTEHDLRNGEYLCANWPKFCYFQALRAYNQVTQDLTDSEKSERDYHLNKLDDEKGHLRYFAVQETCGFGPNQFGPYLLHGAGTLEFLMISCDWKEEYQMEHSSPRYGYKYIRAPSLVGRDWTPVLHDLYAPRLCTFICADIQLNQDIFPILSRFPNLQHVRLRSNKYGRKMRLNILRTFISLKQLRHLHLEDVLLYYGDNRKEDPLEFMEEHIYQHRKKEPNETVATSPIQYIKFDQVNLMTGSLLHAMTYITTLKHIDINFSKECNYNQNELDRFTKLLAHNALFVEYIKLRRLRWSLIWDTLSPLAALPRLKVLDVCGIGAHTVVDASALSNLLKGTNSLQQINIWQIYLIGMRQLTGKRERKVGKYVEKYVVPKDKFISTRSICPSRKQIDIAIESQDFVRNKPPRSRYNRL